MANSNLSEARLAKNDEYYTKFEDIERELSAYLEFDENVFKDKTVLLPCDDPEWSNFTKYFAQNFERLGLKKMISTSYALDSKPADLKLQASLFETESSQFDKKKTNSRGKIFTVERDVNGDKRVNIEDLTWQYLDRDGDFRSDEVGKLLEEADAVITNPPFSQFRDFFAWVTESGKQFLIIGNKNATSYKEIFPYIMRNEVWPGYTPMGADLLFRVPDAVADELVRTSKQGSKWRMVDGEVFARSSSVWLTNIDHGRRHTPLALMSTADNIKFSKHQEIKGIGYHTYENYDGIDVPYVDAIPNDYAGVMGVPITFLGKYCPEQFEIIGNGQVMANELGIEPVGKKFVDDYYAQGNKGQITPKWNNLVYRIGKTVHIPYQRILIRHRNPA